MTLLNRIKAVFGTPTNERLFAMPLSDRLSFKPSIHKPEDEHWEIKSPLAIHGLNELKSSGLALEVDSAFCMDWGDIYSALEDP